LVRDNRSDLHSITFVLESVSVDEVHDGGGVVGGGDLGEFNSKPAIADTIPRHGPGEVRVVLRGVA